MRYLILILFLNITLHTELLISPNNGIDLGKFHTSDIQKTEIKFKNTGKKLIIIQKIRSSCPCLKIITKLPHKLAYLEELIVSVETLPNELELDFTKLLFIQSISEGKSSIMKYLIKGIATPRVKIKPSRTIIIDCDKDKPIKIEFSAREKFTFMRFSIVNSDGVKVKIKKNSNNNLSLLTQFSGKKLIDFVDIIFHFMVKGTHYKIPVRIIHKSNLLNQ